MHDIAFADALRPARVSVLHVGLFPYAIGHEVKLLQARNPLACDLPNFHKLSEKEQREALSWAVLNCSENWGDEGRPDEWLKNWMKANPTVDWEPEIVKFCKYRQAGSSCPPVEMPDNSGRQLGGPMLARLVRFLAQHLGKTESEAMDYPLGAAYFHYFTFLEEDGSIEIVNQVDTDFERWCLAQDALEAKKEAA